jgi:hypothetical protein
MKTAFADINYEIYRTLVMLNHNSTPISLAKAIATLALLPTLLLFLIEASRPVPFTFSVQVVTMFVQVVTMFAMLAAVVGAYGAWRNRDWSGWPIILSLSWTASIGIWGISHAKQDGWWGAIAISALVFLLTIVSPVSRLQKPTIGVRLFCASVVSLTWYVTFWGLLFPKGLGFTIPGFASGFNDSLPFVSEIPPLHARFIGSVYLGATVICLTGIFTRRWTTGWMVQTVIFLWTFLLLVVTFRHLEAFDWGNKDKQISLWFWMASYTALPTISLWLLKRIETEIDDNPTLLPAWARSWLFFQGAVFCLLSLLGFLAAPLLASIWPWKLPEVLSHIYSAPFATFGITSYLVAQSRGNKRQSVVPFCWAVFALASGSIISSILHIDKFTTGALNTYAWFGLFGTVAFASGLIATLLYTKYKGFRLTSTSNLGT